MEGTVAGPSRIRLDDPGIRSRRPVTRLPTTLGPLRRQRVEAPSLSRSDRPKGCHEAPVRDRMAHIAADLEKFAHVDHPSKALHLLCRDVACAQIHSGAGSLRLNVHLRRTFVYAHVVGRIVGVDLKERKAVWLVDDGTSVVAVHYTHNARPIARPPVQRKGKQRALESGQRQDVSGIPDEYIRPVAVAAKQIRTARKDDAVDPKALERSVAHLVGCSLVSVCGRIDTWFGEENVVQVDRIVPPGKSEDDLTYRSAREGYIAQIQDLNEEATHVLKAIELAESDYNFPAITSHSGLIEMSHINPDILKERQPLENGRGRPVAGVKQPHLPSKPDSEAMNDRHEASLTADIKDRSARRSRRLRDFRKLPDSQLTDQVLRIYVQKHIVDHCSQAVTALDKTGGHPREDSDKVISISDSSSDEEEGRIRKRSKKDLDTSKRMIRTLRLDQPPAFTIDYLMRVRTLRALAFRVVAVELERQRKRRQIQPARQKSPSARSRETDANKVRRLFEAVIRDIALDGMIAVADARITRVERPFDGLKPLQRGMLRRVDPDNLLSWADEEGGVEVCEKAGDTSLDASFIRWRGGGSSAKDTHAKKEAYQLVNANLLAPIVLSVLGGDPVGSTVSSSPVRPRKRLGTTAYHHASASTTECVLDADLLQSLEGTPAEQIFNKLRTRDDRWRKIRLESVVECISYLQIQSRS